MKRIFGVLFVLCFIWAIIGLFVVIWDFNWYNIKVEFTMWILTFIFYNLDEIIIDNYGK